MNKSQDAIGIAAPPPNPRRKDGADRRAEFIDVAIRLFSGRPYAEVSIDEIAAEADVAKSLLYYYFGGKRGLYVAGLERLANEMHAELSAAASDPSTPPMERLMLALDAHLAFIEKHPDGYRELLSSASSHPEIQAIMEGEQVAIVDLLLSNLPPEVPRGPAVTLAVKAWGAFVDGAELAWLASGEMDRNQVKELCSRVLYGAILAAIEVDKKALAS